MKYKHDFKVSHSGEVSLRSTGEVVGLVFQIGSPGNGFTRHDGKYRASVRGLWFVLDVEKIDTLRNDKRIFGRSTMLDGNDMLLFKTRTQAAKWLVGA